MVDYRQVYNYKKNNKEYIVLLETETGLMYKAEWYPRQRYSDVVKDRDFIVIGKDLDGYQCVKRLKIIH